MYPETQTTHFSIDHSALEACIEALYTAKWPDGFRCPDCGHRHAYEIRTRKLPLFQCRLCHHQASLIAGTIMEGSRTDLRKWFHAMHLVASASPGINALQLSKIISVTYKTAWLILHKIRHAIAANNKAPISGHVQLNSAFYGKPWCSILNPHPKRQALLVGASVNDQGEIQEVRIMHMPERHLTGTTIRSTGITAFTMLHVDQANSRIESNILHFNRKRFRPLLAAALEASRWLNQTFHGIGPKHLQRYLEEFVYHYNGVIAQTPVLPHLTRLCATSPRTTYSAIIHGSPSATEPIYRQARVAS
ncbi:transposase [Paenibacillus puerhi]|uniref:transposase n=1 Tax=Paenibacillus puerhi TaxID=2692622 RepID=UPI00135678B7|nr:transposase [Paenibacillus puerhi]